jgi:hypothetical protein
LDQLLCLEGTDLRRTMKRCPHTIAFLYLNQRGAD